MGQAPKIIEEIRRSREQAEAEEQQWSIDPATGLLRAEVDPSKDPQLRPQPVRVARQTTD